MSNINRLQVRLRALDCDGFVVPSTDEYLSEFAQPFTRRLEWVSGFRGSMGLAVVLQDRVGLFLDGRYRSQGERDTADLGVEVMDASESSTRRWLAKNLGAGSRLAIDTRLQSQPDVERIMSFAARLGIEMVDLPQNPIDELWGADRPTAPSSTVVDYPTQFAGAAAVDKCVQLREWLVETESDCYLLADPEDVAWLLNVRTNESLAGAALTGWPVVPICLSRVIVDVKGDVSWFVDSSRLESGLNDRIKEAVTIVAPNRFESFLEKRATGRVVSANLHRTPYRYAAIAARVGTVRNDAIVARRRWKKHPNEIARAREGHFKDGQAVIRFLAWVQRSVLERTVTEIEAAQKLTVFRSTIADYRGISMPLMSASGPSGAMPHYVPSEHTNRRLNDHPIYWMDSGGQYYGCSTDNTVCIAIGAPEARHIKAHTLVVKGYIALARVRFPVGISSTQIDSFARQYLWREGMDYNHGTGHGIGNFMNIHEGPYIRREIDHPMVAPMEAGMIVSNEPAFYADGDFGIRIESHLVVVSSKHAGFLEFETLSRLPIDPRLIDQSLLNAEEKRWLAEYHVGIFDGYKGCFDEETSRWLQEIAESYVAIASA